MVAAWYSPRTTFLVSLWLKLGGKRIWRHITVVAHQK
jgi:hypothetical protein